MNPYWGLNVVEFIFTFFKRLFTFSFFPLASDEVQVLTLSCVAISCSLIGPFLVLRKMTMFANSLSHTVLLGIGLSFICLGSSDTFSVMHLLLGAFLASVLTCVLTEVLVKWFSLAEEASVGLVFTFLFALGIVIVTFYLKNVHLGIESIMGNVDALSFNDLFQSMALVFLNGSFIVLFYRRLLIASFDSGYANVLGLKTNVYHFALLFVLAITCIGAFRAVGVVLVLAFLVGPYLTARIFSHRLKPLICLSVAIGVGASFLGVALARHILSVYHVALSTGGLVVCLIGAFYFLAIGCKQLQNLRQTKAFLKKF